MIILLAPATGIGALKAPATGTGALKARSIVAWGNAPGFERLRIQRAEGLR
jgi:hypothetical protein